MEYFILFLRAFHLSSGTESWIQLQAIINQPAFMEELPGNWSSSVGISRLKKAFKIHVGSEWVLRSKGALVETTKGETRLVGQNTILYTKMRLTWNWQRVWKVTKPLTILHSCILSSPDINPVFIHINTYTSSSLILAITDAGIQYVELCNFSLWRVHFFRSAHTDNFHSFL